MAGKTGRKAIEGEIELGDLARDRISGFEGIVVGITRWLNGCARPILAPRELKDGSPIPEQSFDINQLDLVEKAAVPPVVLEKAETGGPRPTPSRR